MTRRATLVGKNLLHYTITAELGAGGMGRVFVARDTRTDRKVALKLLPAEASDPEARERLAREAQAAARLSHPGIVTLFALEEAEGQLFLVEELVEGETLAGRLKGGALGPAETLRLAKELSAALAHAHQHGVLHRDLKPDNVLVTSGGSYKITDFGLARLEGASALTRSGTFVGTLPYMAPERLRGAAGDARSDLFALGAVLYEALSGRRAFPGESAEAVLHLVLGEEPPPPEVRGPVAESLRAVIAQLLEKEPARRPASAEAVAGALGTISASVGAPAARRRRAVVGATAAAAMLVLLAVAAWLLRGRGAGTEPAAEPAVAVLYFDNLADPADPGRLGPIAGNLLVTSLAQAPDLHVLGTQHVLDVMRQLGKAGDRLERSAALQVARRARARSIVTGSIVQTLPFIVMTAEVTDVASGKVLEAARVEGAPGQSVFEVVDALGARLTRRMVPALETTRLQPVAQRGSADLEANRLYLQGLELLAGGRNVEAIRSFEQALRRDPGFAQALYHQAIGEWWNGEPGNAAEAVDRARAHADRLDAQEREVVEGLRDMVRRRWSAARDRFARLAAEHPENRLYLYGLLEGEFHGGAYERAAAAGRRALEVDPEFSLAGIHLVDALRSLGRLDEARRTARDLLAREPRNPSLWFALVRAEVRAGSGPAALEAARQARAHGSLDLDTRRTTMLLSVNLGLPDSSRAWGPPQRDGAGSIRDFHAGVEHDWALRAGRFREAMRIATQAWAQTPPEGFGGGPGIPWAAGLTAAASAGDTARALAWADSVAGRVARWGGAALAPSGRLARYEVWLRLGRMDRAESVLRELEVRFAPDTAGDLAQVVRGARAQLAAARGRVTEVEDLLSGASYYGPPVISGSYMQWIRARAYVNAGQAAAALGVLDTLMGAPLLWPDDAVRLWLYRGRALEQLGRNDEAAASYRELLRLWKDADPGTPEVAGARAALARLGREASRFDPPKARR